MRQEEKESKKVKHATITTREVIEFLKEIQDAPITDGGYLGTDEPVDSIYTIAEGGDIWVFGEDHEGDHGKRIRNELIRKYPDSEVYDNLESW